MIILIKSLLLYVIIVFSYAYYNIYKELRVLLKKYNKIYERKSLYQKKSPKMLSSPSHSAKESDQWALFRAYFKSYFYKIFVSSSSSIFTIIYSRTCHHFLVSWLSSWCWSVSESKGFQFLQEFRLPGFSNVCRRARLLCFELLKVFLICRFELSLPRRNRVEFLQKIQKTHKKEICQSYWVIIISNHLQSIMTFKYNFSKSFFTSVSEIYLYGNLEFVAASFG